MIPSSLRLSSDFAPTVRRIKASGFENSYFGEPVGGYRIQQNAEEFAALTLFLRRVFPALKNYLEIGIGAAGTTRMLYELHPWRRAAFLDDGREFRVPAAENLPHCGEHRMAWLDSHSDAARKWLASLGGAYDFILIDAGHSRRDVELDLELVRPYCHKRTLIAFHDIHMDGRWVENCPEWYADGGVMAFWRESEKIQRVVELYNERVECPLGIGVARIRE